MEQLLDFFARLGDVTFGIMIAILLVLLIGGAIVEIIDFLIVDPITRAKRHEVPTESVKED